VVVPVTVHVPADVGAARQWLARRQPVPWAGEKEPPENRSIAERLEAARKRLEEHDREKAAADAIRFAEAVTARVAETLARHGIQE